MGWRLGWRKHQREATYRTLIAFSSFGLDIRVSCHLDDAGNGESQADARCHEYDDLSYVGALVNVALAGSVKANSAGHQDNSEACYSASTQDRDTSDCQVLAEPFPCHTRIGSCFHQRGQAWLSDQAQLDFSRCSVH
jgi:hypothetical protein